MYLTAPISQHGADCFKHSGYSVNTWSMSKWLDDIGNANFPLFWRAHSLSGHSIDIERFFKKSKCMCEYLYDLQSETLG